MGNRFCEQCGAQAPVDGQFCEECGAQKEQTGLTHFTRVRELFEQAIGMEPAHRDRWLEDECRGDASLLAEIRGMMPVAGHSSFLEAPAMPPPSFASPEPPPIRESVGSYRLLRELGRGGMGVVYLAMRDDGAFRKNVALKLLLGEQVTPEFILRFKQERQVLAALDHSNIARILDGGDTADGMPFYVMEYVEGLPLDQYCDEQRLSLTGRIKIFQQVCQAVDYLHKNSILHRDLKPSNILVSVEGSVKLLDFGIAKVVGAGSLSPELTGLQGRPLTPTYASPEQMAGGSLQKASDIYSLGVILYRLLTGRPPYDGIEDKVEKLASRQDPPLPSANIRDDLRAAESTAQLRRAIMGELDSIVLMAMRYDPKARYQSAADFAMDLQRFLDGLAVMAHHHTVAGLSVKLLKRKRAAVAVLAILAAVGGFGAWQWRRVEVQKTEVARREALLREQLDQLDSNAQSAARPVTEEIRDIRKLKQAFATNYTAALAGRPGRSPERDALLSRGVRYLDKLQPQAAGSPELGLEIAEAYQQLALLQEKTFGPRAPERQMAVATYQKAADTLGGVSTVIPDDAKLRSRLAAVIQRIMELGGSAARMNGTPFPSPVGGPRGGPAKNTTLLRSQENKTISAANISPANSVIPESERSYSAFPADGSSRESAGLAEVEHLLDSVTSKVESADQSLDAYRRKLARQGQTLGPDLLTRLSLMRVSLERAKREIADGNAAAAKDSLMAAEELANRILRLVGR